MEGRNEMSPEEVLAEIARLDKVLPRPFTQWDEIHKVDIAKAQSAMGFMIDYVARNGVELLKAETAAREILMGLILTAVATGLVPNAAKATTEFRDKIFMAFDIGYVYGRLGTGKK